MQVRFIHRHIDCFPENLRDYSEEQGGRFHQDVRGIGRRYQRRWDVSTLTIVGCSSDKQNKNKKYWVWRSIEEKKKRFHKKSKLKMVYKYQETNVWLVICVVNCNKELIVIISAISFSKRKLYVMECYEGHFLESMSFKTYTSAKIAKCS